MVSKDQENFLVGALVGGAMGAAAALLLTPYPGAEIRKKMRKGWDQVNGHRTKAHVAHAPARKTVKKRPPAKRKAATAKHSSASHSTHHKS